MTKQAPSARRDAARGTAIQALAYLAENMERLEPFMAITGLEPRRTPDSSPAFWNI